MVKRKEQEERRMAGKDKKVEKIGEEEKCCEADEEKEDN